MKKSHDLESMLFVVKLYEPSKSATQDFKKWWQDNVKGSGHGSMSFPS